MMNVPIEEELFRQRFEQIQNRKRRKSVSSTNELEKRKSSLRLLDELVCDDWPQDPNELLLYGAKNLCMDAVVVALEKDADVNVVCEETKQTAAIKAIQNGSLEMLEYLLLHGADPEMKDGNFRNCFYFACFASKIPQGQHGKFMNLLLAFMHKHQRPVLSELLLMGAYAVNTVGVTDILLNQIKINTLSKDSNGHSKFNVLGLNKLDSPLVQMTWPDGSLTNAGTTFVHVLISKKAGQQLVHPACLSLMSWKWRTFGSSLYLKEFTCFGVQIILISLLCFLSNGEMLKEANGTNGSINHYAENGLGGLRISVEILLLISAVFGLDIILQEAGVILFARFKKNFYRKPKFKSKLKDIIIPLVPQTCLIALALCRVAQAPQRIQVVLLSVAAFFIWERFVTYMSINSAVGPFFIMLGEMFKRDLLPFLLVLGAVLMAFACSISILISNNLDIDDMSPDVTYRSLIYAAVDLLFGFVTNDSFMLIRSNWILNDTDHFDWLATLLFSVYTIIGPILALNWLTARFANTYQEINKNSVAEWALRRFRFLSLREAFVPNPHFGFILRDNVECKDGQCHTLKSSSSAKVNPSDLVPQNALFMQCQESCETGYTFEAKYAEIYQAFNERQQKQGVDDIRDLMHLLLLRVDKLESIMMNQQQMLAQT